MGVSLRRRLKNPLAAHDFKKAPGHTPRRYRWVGLVRNLRFVFHGMCLVVFFVGLFSCSARQVALRAFEPEIRFIESSGKTWVLPVMAHLNLLQVRREISLRLPAPRGPESPTNMGERVRPNPLPYLEAFLVSIPNDQPYHIGWDGVGVEVDGSPVPVLTPTLFRSNYPASRYDTEGFVALAEEGGTRRVLFTEAWPMGARRVVWTFPVFVGAHTNETTQLVWTNDTRWVRRSFDFRSSGGLP